MYKIWNKDVYFVSYMGYFLVVFLRIFTNKTIVFDYYVSLHDMLIQDRKLAKKNSLLGKLTFWLDKRSLELADYIIVDTTQLINTAVKNYGIDRKKFTRLPLAVNEEKIFPKEIKRHKEMFTLVYMGSYIPFHGVDIVMETAKILEAQGEEVHFLMLGKGQKYEESLGLAKEYRLKDIEFIDYVSMEELNDYYNASDVTLGAFGAGERAKVFITNKAYESFAVGKPHLTLETPAMKELFVGDESIFFVEDSKAESLANKILEIKNNKALCNLVAQNAGELYKKTLTNKSVTALLEEKILSKLS
jgi:glycosyltransferase involved in cell wall biosynthesis